MASRGKGGPHVVGLSIAVVHALPTLATASFACSESVTQTFLIGSRTCNKTFNTPRRDVSGTLPPVNQPDPLSSQ